MCTKRLENANPDQFSTRLTDTDSRDELRERWIRNMDKKGMLDWLYSIYVKYVH